jgi:serine/threonine protein kinase
LTLIPNGNSVILENLELNMRAHNMSRLHFYTSPKAKSVFEMNRPKYYANVCLEEPNSYSNYVNHTIVYNDSDKYEFHEKLGNGEFATVYAAINKETGEKVAIKVLKPIEMARVNREIMVM